MKKTRIFILIFYIITFAICLDCSKDIPNRPIDGGDDPPTPALYPDFDRQLIDILIYAAESTGNNAVQYERLNPDCLTGKMAINGSYYDFGLVLGTMARRIGLYPRYRNESNRQINQAIEQMYARLYPQFLDEARGVAHAYSREVADLDLRHLECQYFTNLTRMIFELDKYINNPYLQDNACSVISYYISRENRHIVGRNLEA